ncbi:hypothetical protein V1264_000087 [Littorina saxatilis]|uniref:Uncharacterized protein n=3 Tax=Littorina saxatilis TaxID=31220 RepID=A0AAN9BYL3_9CAEN
MLNPQQKDCKIHITKRNNLAVYATQPIRCYSTSHRQAYLPEPSIASMVATPRVSQSRSKLIAQQYRKSSSIPILQQEKWILATTNPTLHIGMKMINTLAIVKKKQAMFQTPGESCRYYSTGRDTVEKKLLQLMDMWEVEKAVALLRESVEEGVLPHPNVVLNLQQQLANLGEVECLLNVHDFLKEHNLITDDKFFHYLNQAYYNSGRISEGVSVLRLLYHRTRKFPDVDIYFTLLTVMVLRHFPDRIDLILSFVTDLKDAEKPVLEPEASLWKCYMMMEKWTEADNLLLHNEELRPLLPQQVTRVCQDVDKTDFNRAAVLSQMLDLPFIRQKLRVLVAETLMAELCKQKQWLRLLKSLKRIKSQGLPVHVDKLASALDDLKRNLTPQYDDQIHDLRQWCEILQAGGNQ